MASQQRLELIVLSLYRLIVCIIDFCSAFIPAGNLNAKPQTTTENGETTEKICIISLSVFSPFSVVVFLKIYE